jgi:iron complex outermembrane receptor protein
MIFQRKKVAAALACIVGAGGAMAASGAYAQAQNPDVPSLTRQPAPDIRVEVTGSNIKRVEGEGALPVQIITRQEIEKTGATTVPELLQTISAINSAGQVSLANNVGAASFSAQTASLRGLGGQFTLVLLNGHRIEGFPGEIQAVAGVNLASIPFDAIERVEILKDGASAIYGSDAIAGVINFITRSDYTGAEVTAYAAVPTRSGGGNRYQATGSFGIGDLAKDRYNVFASISYQQQEPLEQRERNFSNTSFRPEIGLVGISSNTNPGLVTDFNNFPITSGVVTNANGPARLAGPNECGASTFLNDPVISNTVGCYYDPSNQPGVLMINKDKLWNAYARGTFQLNESWQAYAELNYSHDETGSVIQPSPVSSIFPFGDHKQFSGRITLQPDSPYYPHAVAAQYGIDGQPLNVRYRTFDNGYRDKTDTNEHGSIYTGVKGTAWGWDWDGTLYYNKGKTIEHTNGGYFDYRILQPLLNSGQVNFFGPNTPETIALEQAANINADMVDTEASSYGVDLKASGEIAKLPAGPLSLAFGGDFRRETLDQTFNDAIKGGFVAGYGGSFADVSGSRNQEAGFVEINVPIVKTLEMDAAVRYDHYSDFGGTTNPKVSLRWQPTRALLFRGSWGEGFVAPSLFQLKQPPIGSVTAAGTSDPIRCPVTGLIGVDCKTQFGVTFGGNPNLKPQESEQTSFGMVIEPIPNTSFSIDWFKLNVKNFIQDGIPVSTLLNNEAQFPGFITRGPVDPNFPNLPGPITDIQALQLNIGAVKIEGLDLDLRYRSPIQSWGRLTFDIAGTYYIKYDNQNTDGSFSGVVGNAYGSVNTGIIPRWKQYATLTWDLGPWSTTLANTYQTSYTDVNTDYFGNLRTVGSLSLWDLQTTYSGFKNLKLTLGVKNLFDRDPPVSNQQNVFIVGFDPSYYDPRARFIYGSINYKFK